MDRALGIISQELRSRTDSGLAQKTTPVEQGQFSRPVFLYDQKLSHRVREMLLQHGLINPELQELAQGFDRRKRGIVMPAAAANVVLSFIADSIARERGLIAITDQTLEFAMNTLLGLQVPVRPPTGADEGSLTSVFARILIPREVGEISFADYKILRERTSDLRAAFGEFTRECSRANGLQRIESAAYLQQRIYGRATVVSEEFRKFQTSAAASLRFIRDWWPITIGGVLALAKDIVPPEWALLFGAAGQVVKVVHEATTPSPNRNKERVYNLAAELGNEIRALPRVSQLLREPRHRHI